jgi:threonine/homoserine/homoserine lactone efflux protein
MAKQQDFNRRGRVIALVIAGTGLFWIAATVLGQSMGLSQRSRAFLDLVAGAGFIWAIWMIYGLYRDRRDHEE